MSRIALFRLLGPAVSLSSLMMFTGCAGQFSATPNSSSTLVVSGSVHGGQQAVSGATVQMYAVGTGGDGRTSTSLISASVTTGGDGGFTLSPNNSPLYSCTNATQVYLVATGGNPGLSGSGSSNPNLALMAALGSCSSLSTATRISINELTTVAAVSALDLYMSSQSSVGSSSYDSNQLAADFTLATQLVTTSTGAAPGLNVPSGYTVPTDLIATLGNILAACVNSAGVPPSGSSLCGSLFTYATPPGGTAPTNTIAAMLNIANHPTLNTTQLYGLIQTAAPFSSAITSAPSSYQVGLQPASFSVTRTFYAFPETDQSITPLYTLVNNARRSIDMTMYGLKDTVMSGDLVAACQRGVTVRVVLDQNNEKSLDTPAFNQINAQAGCSAVWANTAFQVTHQKSLIIDGTQVAILSLNLETVDYALTRDYGMVENDPNDIAAMQATFNADYAAGTTSSGTVGASDFSYLPPSGDGLIWSPTSAQASLIGLINNATSTLLVENEEMSASNIVTALENACQRGVTVNITMTTSSSYATNFKALEAAGCGVHVYANNSKTLYIHAKAILADYGTSGVNAYMGSINFSTASMVENREMGLYVKDAASQQTLYNTLVSDYAGAPAY